MKILNINYPEMHGTTNDTIQAEFVLGKYRVKSLNQLPLGKGIKYDGVVPELGSSNIPNKNAGHHKYYMTPAAFDKFSKSNELTLNILLD